MNIGTRLRQLRETQELSQGDIEERTGLLRCYISRIECGHTVPSLETLEKWAKAFGLELYQLFFVGKAEPETPKGAASLGLRGEERRLLNAFASLGRRDKALLCSLASKMTQLNRRRSAQC